MVTGVAAPGIVRRIDMAMSAPATLVVVSAARATDAGCTPATPPPRASSTTATTPATTTTASQRANLAYPGFMKPTLPAGSRAPLGRGAAAHCAGPPVVQ